MTKKKIKTAKGTERVYEKNIYTRFNSSGQEIGFSVKVGNVRIHAPGQKRGTFKTLQAARRARDNYIEARKDGVYSECRITLNEVFNELYIKGVDTGKKSANTQANYKNFYYNYIEPILQGEREIRDFTRQDIKYMRKKIMEANSVKTGEPLSQGSKRTLLNFAFRIFRFALHEEYINNDICRSIDIPPATRAKQECLSPEIIEILDSEANRLFPLHLNLYAGYYLLLETGMRAGELCGLRWCDVDLEHSIIHIKQQINRASKKPGKTKTPKSKRELYVTDRLYFVLCNVLDYRKKTGIKVKDTDYILTSGKGGYTGKYIAYRSLASGIERLGRRCGIKITTKSFRKTNLTMVAKEHGSLVAAKQAGHTTTKMIETVYADTNTIYQNAFPLMGKPRHDYRTQNIPVT